MAEQRQNNNIPTIEPNTLYVGQGVIVKGDISVPGIVVVDGEIEGNVTGRAVWVSPSGLIKGRITATEAEIHGTISDNIEIKQLMIVHATARVLGDICYGELQLEKGAVISGSLSCVSDQKEPVLESVLGKGERPKIVHRTEAAAAPAPRPLNGGGPHPVLAPPDYRVAS